MTEPLRDRCHRRWPSLLTILGVDHRYLTGKHGPCPICRQGEDRFRFDDKKGVGSWICSKCGAGDGIALLMRINSWDFKECATRLEEVIGKAERTEARRKQDDASLRAAMNRLWSSGVAVTSGDPVSLYLEGRGIRLSAVPSALRFVERCRYEDASWHPAMIAKVTAPDGKPSILHRSYLTPDGRKADVASPRRLMPGKFAQGGAIRLAEPGPVLGIAEGIETALSASIIWRVPCWAAVSAGMLMQWQPPEGVEEIIVFADNDPGFAGQTAGYALAQRLAARGCKVRVEMPLDTGMDWNDVLRAEQGVAADVR